MAELDSFLSESPAIVPAAEPAPAPVAVEPVAAPAPAAAEPPKGEPVSAPPARELPPRGDDGRWVKVPEESQEHMVPLSALLAERDRRQQAERAAEERKPQAPPVDVWENPAGYVDARVQEASAKLLEQVEPLAESRARKLFLDYTESEARGRHADYD